MPIESDEDEEAALDALERCAFLLYKIHSEDVAALSNAPDAIAEAVKILRRVGRDDEWFSRAIEDEDE